MGQPEPLILVRNRAEQDCLLRLQKAGWQVFRRGWPDFIAEKDGRVVVIEVKDRSGFSDEQVFVLDWLSGLSESVYVWRPGQEHLVKWSDVRQAQRSAECQTGHQKASMFLDSIGVPNV